MRPLVWAEVFARFGNETHPNNLRVTRFGNEFCGSSSACSGVMSSINQDKNGAIKGHASGISKVRTNRIAAHLLTIDSAIFTVREDMHIDRARFACAGFRSVGHRGKRYTLPNQREFHSINSAGDASTARLLAGRVAFTFHGNSVSKSSTVLA
jgi:hypothetical protein